MKKYLKILKMATLGLALMSLNFDANATMPVVDYSAIMQTAMNFIKESAYLETQIKYLHQQLDSLKTFEPGQYKWSNVSQTINNLGNVIQQANGLAYNAQNVSAQFQKDFPGYKPPQDFSQQYSDNVKTTLNTLNGVLQSSGMSANDFTNEPARIAALQNMAQNAKGQTQAIQASAQISTEMLSQIQLLRQTVIAQTNAQTTYYAQQVQTQATQQAELDSVIKAGSTKVPAYGSSGNYLKIPNF